MLSCIANRESRPPTRRPRPPTPRPPTPDPRPPTPDPRPPTPDPRPPTPDPRPRGGSRTACPRPLVLVVVSVFVPVRSGGKVWYGPSRELCCTSTSCSIFESRKQSLFRWRSHNYIIISLINLVLANSSLRPTRAYASVPTCALRPQCMYNTNLSSL